MLLRPVAMAQIAGRDHDLGPLALDELPDGSFDLVAPLVVAADMEIGDVQEARHHRA